MIWLSTKEAAELLGYEQSTIRKKAKNGEYIHRYIPSATGQGGKKLEILLESLPEQAQKAYHNKMVNVRPFSIRITPAQRSSGKKANGEP